MTYCQPTTPWFTSTELVLHICTRDFIHRFLCLYCANLWGSMGANGPQTPLFEIHHCCADFQVPRHKSCSTWNCLIGTYFFIGLYLRGSSGWKCPGEGGVSGHGIQVNPWFFLHFYFPINKVCVWLGLDIMTHRCSSALASWESTVLPLRPGQQPRSEEVTSYRNKGLTQVSH